MFSLSKFLHCSSSLTSYRIKNSRFFKEAKYGKTVRTLLRDILSDANTLGVALGISVSTTSVQEAQMATMNMSKMMKLTAPEEIDEVLEYAMRLTMEGDKLLFGFGTRSSPELAFKKYMEAGKKDVKIVKRLMFNSFTSFQLCSSTKQLRISLRKWTRM